MVDTDRLRRCADTMRRFKSATIDAHELDAAANEIDRLRGALDDVACGRGMFGIDVAKDLAWAMSHCGMAIGLEQKEPD